MLTVCAQVVAASFAPCSFTWHELSLQTVELELHEVEFGAVPILDVRQLYTLRHAVECARQSKLEKYTRKRRVQQGQVPGEVEYTVIINSTVRSVLIFPKEGN